MNKTIWNEIDSDNYEKLSSNISTDVLVIGGGICGILCAYRLAKEKKNVILVEQNRIGGIKTRKTTAVITALQDLLYSDLVNTLGYEKARLYLESTLMAINEYKSLALEYDFDFEEVSSYKYSLSDTSVLIKEMAALRDLGYRAYYHENINLPLNVNGAIEFKNQVQINPLKLIDKLKNEFKIYENTKIVKIYENNAITKEGFKISANNIIVCSGYPFLKMKGMFPLKQYQEKSYVVAIKNESGFNGNVIGLNKDDLYFRSYKDYLIIGDNQTRTGNNINGFNRLEKYVKEVYNTKILYKWINQDCVTLDSIPYIGKYGSFDNVYVCTGFNLWGMTGAMISSVLMCDYILKRDNKLFELFSTNRKINIGNAIKNTATAAKGLLSPGGKRCKHLGCKLKWNELDKTYECPCHGSKYDIDGKLLEGPSLK